MPRPEYYGNPASLTEDVDVVRAIYAAFAARDIEGALDFVSTDCEIHLEGTSRAGRSGPYLGHDGLREYFADVERVWQELEIHADDFRTVPGSVIVMGHVTGRGGDGVAVRRRAVWTWRLRDGRAVLVRVSDLGADSEGE